MGCWSEAGSGHLNRRPNCGADSLCKLDALAEVCEERPEIPDPRLRHCAKCVQAVTVACMHFCSVPLCESQISPCFEASCVRVSSGDIKLARVSSASMLRISPAWLLEQPLASKGCSHLRSELSDSRVYLLRQCKALPQPNTWMHSIHQTLRSVWVLPGGIGV